jgi:hypothetical protein
MTNRVSGNGVTISVVKSVDGLAVNPLPHRQQHLQSTRRNPLPVKRIDGSLLMCHKHLACALVEQMESGKTSSGPDRVLHHAPEAFDRIEVMATMGR